MLNDKMKIIAEQQSQRVVLKGNTIKYNQLVENGTNTETINGVTFTNLGNGTWLVNGTATATAWKDLGSNISGITNHKIAIVGCPKVSGSYVSASQGTTHYDNGDGYIGTFAPSIFKATIGIANGTTCNNLIFKPKIVDLTALGLSNITTLTDFYATDLGKFIQNGNYLPYSATNTIYSVKSPFTFKKEIEYNNQCQLVNRDTWTDKGLTMKKQDGYFEVNGTSTGSGYDYNDIETSQYPTNDLIVGHKYIVGVRLIGGSVSNENNNAYIVANEPYDETRGYEYNAYIFTCTASQYIIVRVNAVNCAYNNSKFAPYFIDLTQLGLDSINSVEDFYKTELGQLIQNGNILPYSLANTKGNAITPTTYIRTKRVDLGTLTWTYDSTNKRFYTTLSDVVNTGTWNTKMSCGKYQSSAVGGDITKDKVISSYGTDLFIRDLDYDNATDFKTAMSGTILEYETAETLELNGFDNDKSIDLGILNWKYDSEGFYYIDDLEQINSAKCKKYPILVVSDWRDFTNENTIYIGHSYYNIAFINSNISSVADLKQLLSGVILTYETDKPSIFDTYENHSGKVVRKIKRVKINDLDLTKSGSNFNATLTDIKSHSGTRNVPQILCSEYNVVSPVEITLANKVISQNNKVLTIKDTNYANVSALKSAKGNVEIYYILETQATENERSVLVDHRYNKVVDSNGNEIDTD